MAIGDEYRIRAAEFEAKAKFDPNPAMRAEFEILARSYRRLAEQAERNSHTDVVYVPPLTER